MKRLLIVLSSIIAAGGLHQCLGQSIVFISDDGTKSSHDIFGIKRIEIGNDKATVVHISGNDSDYPYAHLEKLCIGEQAGIDTPATAKDCPFRLTVCGHTLRVEGLNPGSPVRIYSINGETAVSGISPATATTMEIDLGAAPNGVLIFTDGKHSQKFINQK